MNVAPHSLYEPIHLAAPHVRAFQSAQEGGDPEAGGYRLDDWQRCQDFNSFTVEADLLFRLAQRSRQQIGVFGLAPAARKGDLAAVHTEWTAADEDQPQPAVGIAIDWREDRRIDQRQGRP